MKLVKIKKSGEKNSDFIQIQILFTKSSKINGRMFELYIFKKMDHKKVHKDFKVKTKINVCTSCTAHGLYLKEIKY